MSELPLRHATRQDWAADVLADADALLGDHAHLEREAAGNALGLIRRRPGRYPADRWVQSLTGIVRDEIEHLSLVSRVLAERGHELPLQHTNPYAAALRTYVRRGEHWKSLVDRLLVSALIELRSCERFGLLGRAGHELSPMYTDLQQSETGHYRLFLTLAAAAAPTGDVDERWDELLDVEAVTIAVQARGPRMHSG